MALINLGAKNVEEGLGFGSKWRSGVGFSGSRVWGFRAL